MKNHVNQIKSKNTLCNGIEDPSSAVSAKEKIINYVNNLNDNKSDVLYLISYLLDIYKINDLELFMKIMSISDCELLKKNRYNKKKDWFFTNWSSGTDNNQTFDKRNSKQI